MSEKYYDPLGRYIPPELQEYEQYEREHQDEYIQPKDIALGAGALLAGGIGIHGANRLMAAARATPWGAKAQASVANFLEDNSPSNIYKKGGQQKALEKKIKGTSLLYNAAKNRETRNEMTNSLTQAFKEEAIDYGPILNDFISSVRNPAVLALIEHQNNLTKLDVDSINKLAKNRLANISDEDIKGLNAYISNIKAVQNHTPTEDLGKLDFYLDPLLNILERNGQR